MNIFICTCRSFKIKITGLQCTSPDCVNANKLLLLSIKSFRFTLVKAAQISIQTRIGNYKRVQYLLLLSVCQAIYLFIGYLWYLILENRLTKHNKNKRKTLKQILMNLDMTLFMIKFQRLPTPSELNYVRNCQVEA